MRKLAMLMIMLSCILFACKKEDKLGTIPNMTFYLSQKPDSLGGSLDISVSGGSYKYINVVINNKLSVSQNNIDIEFTGTSCAGGTCHDLSSPGNMEAKGRVTFGHLPSGNYNLHISMNGEKYHGNLIVTSNEFKINLNASPQITFYLNTTLIKRIPTTALWGGVNAFYGAPSITKFFDTLSTIGVSPSTLREGDYGVFNINSAGQMYSLKYSGYDSVFIYSYTNTFDTLINIGNYFKDSLHIYPSFENGQGQTF